MSIKKTQQELKSEEMKQHIIIIAKQLFSEYGYKKVSVRDIASEAQVTTGTLYYYFKNKDEILEATYENDVVEFEKKLQKKLEAEDEEPMLFTYFCEIMTEHLITDGKELIRYHFFERQKFWERGSAFYSNIINAVEYSAKHIPFRKELTKEEIVDYLLLVFRGTAIMWARSDESFDLKKMMRWNMETAVRGLI